MLQSIAVRRTLGIRQAARTMYVQALPMRWGFGDNYCYIVSDDATKEGTLIDPAAPEEILPEIKRLEASGGLKITSLTNTHHHYDHSDGNAVLHKLYPEVPLYAGRDSPLVTNTPKDGETHFIGQNLVVRAVHTPCHTKDSICWFIEDKKTGEKAVFTGDTLFNCGCGRFFEGDANQMLPSLRKLASLPPTTRVYPGHEYTKSNVKFAQSIEPENEALKKLKLYCDEHEKVTGDFTIKDELDYNPFMRTDNPDLQKKVGTSSAVACMAKLRSMKDKF